MKRSPLKRKTPLRSGSPLTKRRTVHQPWASRTWKRADDDKVTPELHQLVLSRDGRCMAPVLDKALATPCKDGWGTPLVLGTRQAMEALELDHVFDEGMQAMGDRAPSDQYHLVCVCAFHHRQGWATSKHGRALEREYLRSLRPVDLPVLTDSMESQ